MGGPGPWTLSPEPPHRCLSPQLSVCSLYFLYFAFHKVFSENPHVSKYAYEYKDTLNYRHPFDALSWLPCWHDWYVPLWDITKDLCVSTSALCLFWCVLASLSCLCMCYLWAVERENIWRMHQNLFKSDQKMPELIKINTRLLNLLNTLLCGMMSLNCIWLTSSQVKTLYLVSCFCHLFNFYHHL